MGLKVKKPYKIALELMHKQKSYLEKTEVHFNVDKLYHSLPIASKTANTCTSTYKSTPHLAAPSYKKRSITYKHTQSRVFFF